MNSPSTFLHTKQIQSLRLQDLLRLLIADGRIDRHAAESCYRAHKRDRSHVHPIIVVAEQKWTDSQAPDQLLTVETLSRFVAAKADVPYYAIDPLKLDFSSASQLVSQAYAERAGIMPLMLKDGVATIATADPFKLDWVNELARMRNVRIQVVMANPLELQHYLPEVYQLSAAIQSANHAKDGQIVGVQNFEQLIELGKDRALDANEQHVVNIVDWLFKYAFEQRASDIHLEPRRHAGLLRFRIDGVLHQVYQLPANIMHAITSRIKLLGRMDMVEKRRPQDGRLKTVSSDGREIELRLSTMPTAFGEKLVMRIFKPDMLVQDFQSLGLSKRQTEQWQAWTQQPNGLILVTGPTGSGKTTTLYTTLKQLATPEVNVCTIEDPIEMIEPSFNQMQVASQIGLGFADGIRTLMRQDPDIIMVGEIRDRETAEMAIQAALTGHLVLSTLHTNDAPAAITRLLDLGIPAYLLHSCLVGILAQRLVRTLCPHCKQSGILSEEDWRQMTLPFKSAAPAQVYHASGCPQCRQTGYRGRTGLYEMLTMTPALRNHIRAETDLIQLRKAAYQAGMQPMMLNGAEKVAQGQTTVTEVLKVAPPMEV